MKKITILALCLTISYAPLASAKNKCGKKYEIFCKEVKGAKKDSFCWRSKLTDKKRIEKICKTSKKRAAKKRTKKRS